MTKTELVANVAEKTEITKKDAGKVVDAVFETITEEIQKDKVRIAGFGTFEIRDRAERQARNPQTGDKMTIPAKKAPAFKAAKALKELVNK
jgi:DNA-binding protein HU-beta